MTSSIRMGPKAAVPSQFRPGKTSQQVMNGEHRQSKHNPTFNRSVSNHSKWLISQMHKSFGHSNMCHFFWELSDRKWNNDSVPMNAGHLLVSHPRLSCSAAWVNRTCISCEASLLSRPFTAGLTAATHIVVSAWCHPSVQSIFKKKMLTQDSHDSDGAG